MNVDIDHLLSELKANAPTILAAIDADPLLTKRLCPETGLVVANASKLLFSPTAPHQLYAKGLVYRRDPYEVVGVPLLKIYNAHEALGVAHLESMYQRGARAQFVDKADGTFIARHVVDGKVLFSTRGMLETQADDAESQKFFTWTRAIAADRYPQLLDPESSPDATLMFELVGPENRIVTSYSEWNLVYIADFCLHEFVYANREQQEAVAAWVGFTPVKHLGINEHTNFEVATAAMQAQCAGTDREGSVVQFELDGVVVGRVKVKAATYLKLLKVFRGCTYENVSDLARNGSGRGTVFDWRDFEVLLWGQGGDDLPPDLLGAYRQHFEAFVDHWQRCQDYVRAVDHAVVRELVALGVRATSWPRTLTRDERKAFAAWAQTREHVGSCFASVDGKLDTDYVLDKVFKDPEASLTWYSAYTSQEAIA